MDFFAHILKKHRATTLGVLSVIAILVIYIASISRAAGPFPAGSELDPDCEPGAVDCIVEAGGSSPFETGVGSFSVLHTSDSVNTADGAYSFSFGGNSTAGGPFSFAFGDIADAPGDNAFAFGENIQAEGSHSVVFGENTAVDAPYAVSFGEGNTITTSGERSALFSLDNNGYTITDPNIFSIMGGFTGIGTTTPSSLQTLTIGGNPSSTDATIGFGDAGEKAETGTISLQSDDTDVTGHTFEFDNFMALELKIVGTDGGSNGLTYSANWIADSAGSGAATGEIEVNNGVSRAIMINPGDIQVNLNGNSTGTWDWIIYYSLVKI